MKIRIYRSKNGGWYLYGTNFKDKEDKAYCNLFFPQNSEPNINTNYLDIDVVSFKGNSFKNKFGLTIFEYKTDDSNSLTKARIYRDSYGGWYLFGSNFKDKNDKAQCSLFFPQNSEPKTSGDYLDIIIHEAKGNSYKGKFGLTIFKYDLDIGKEDNSKFGGHVESNTIDLNDLEFY